MTSTLAAAPRRSRDYSRRRALLLGSIYLLAGLHIAHWRISGRTLAPLELNELMYTLELGIVTAGFLFMTVAFVGTAVFGRFFCSWACHILALQDLCHWLLGKVRIEPKPVRARVLLLVPFFALFDMFVLPQILRTVEGRPLPSLHLASDAQGWASFLTTDFWRNLPPPGVALATFAICGFLIVWVLGSRSFCTYACPYGALFNLLDRFAPGRLAMVRDCKACGRCTAVCTSHVRVHEEFAAHGMVVNPNCLKDLDCVAVCPNGAAGFAFRRPPGLSSFTTKRAIRPKWDYSWPEEALLASTFVVTIVVVRGLYGVIPFLMGLGIAVIFAFGTVHLLRLCCRPNLRLVPFQLRREGRFSGAGAVFLVLAVAGLGLLAHSAWIRIEEARGLAALVAAETGPGERSVQLASASAHLERRARFGLYETSTVARSRARTAELSGDLARAERILSAEYDRGGGQIETAFALARVIATRGRSQEAARLLQSIVDLSLQPGHTFGPSSVTVADAATVLAHMRAEDGDLEQAERLLRRALELRPTHASALYALGVILAARNRTSEAIDVLQRAVDQGSRDPDLLSNLGRLLLDSGQLASARKMLELAVEADPGHALAHFNLGQLLQRIGDAPGAREQLQRARELDSRLGGGLR